MSLLTCHCPTRSGNPEEMHQTQPLDHPVKPDDDSNEKYVSVNLDENIDIIIELSNKDFL